MASVPPWAEGNLRDALDVVVVPDFRGERRSLFEARALLFLASWIAYGGRARAFPVHLACIDEPPPSVRWLAQRCGAEVSVHPPLAVNGVQTANKLRGLELQGRCDRVLLLDADVLVLADFSELTELGSCVAAMPVPTARNKVPGPHWRRIYAALGLSVPTEAPGVHRTRLDLPLFPYYNGGVVLAPWGCGLRPLWEEHIRRIAALFDEHDPYWPAVGRSDQAGLATALQALRQRGVPSAHLPDRFNANIRLQYWRGLRLSRVALFHAMGFLRGVELGPRLIERGLHRYRVMHVRWALRESQRRVAFPGRLQRLRRQLLPTLLDLHRLSRRIEHLHGAYVAEALRQNGRVRS